MTLLNPPDDNRAASNHNDASRPCGQARYETSHNDGIAVRWKCAEMRRIACSDKRDVLLRLIATHNDCWVVLQASRDERQRWVNRVRRKSYGDALERHGNIVGWAGGRLRARGEHENEGEFLHLLSLSLMNVQHTTRGADGRS